MENNDQNHELQNWGSGENKPFTERPPAYEKDRHFYRVVAWSLSTAIILSVLGALELAYLDKNIPESVVALGSTAVGALAGVLAGSRR